MSISQKTTRPFSEQVVSRTLKNGLQIHVIPDHNAATVSTQFWVRTGSINEGEFLGCGLSHFLEHMVFTGTKKYPGGHEIPDIVTSLGGNLNASTGYQTTSYYINVASEHLVKAMDMVSDMVTAPQFPEELFLREKDVILREAAMGGDDPDRVLFQTLFAAAFRQHPFRIPIIGTPDLIAQVDRERMLKYYDLRYAPHRMTAVVAGDADPEEVFDFYGEKLESWFHGSLTEQMISVEFPQLLPFRRDLVFADPLARFAFGWKTAGDGSPERPALDILLSVLADRDSSRLNVELRTRKELLSDVEAYQYGTDDVGLAVIMGETEPEKMQNALNGVRDVLSEVSRTGITEQELTRVKIDLEMLHWNMLRGSNQQLASAIGRAVSLRGAPAWLDVYQQQMKDVTVDDVRAAAKHCFESAHETLVTMHPETVGQGSGKHTVNTKKSASEMEPVQPEKILLANGQRMLHLKDESSPLVDFSLLLRGGSAFETQKLAGCSALLCECLFTGSGSYSEEEFAEFLEDHGIKLSASSERHGIRVTMSCLKSQFRHGMKALELLLAKPLFPEKEFRREAEILRQEMLSELSDPCYAAFDHTFEIFFGKDHPYGITHADAAENLKTLSREAMIRFYKEVVLDQHGAVYAFTGALTEKEALRAAEDLAGAIHWSPKNTSFPAPPALKPQIMPRTVVPIPREQAVPSLAFPGPGIESDDRILLTLIQNVCNGMSGRLFFEIREKSGLAYYAGMVPFSGFGCGVILFYAGTGLNTVEDIFAKYEEIRHSMEKKGITKSELEAARSKAIFSLAEKRKTAVGRIAPVLNAEYFGLDAGYPQRSRERILTVTRQEVNAVIRKYFSAMPRCEISVIPSGEMKKK